MLHNRLSQLGACPVLHRGLGDDQDGRGLDHALAPWLDALWPALHRQLGLPEPGLPALLPFAPSDIPAMCTRVLLPSDQAL